jgi:hypothetical protein
MACLRGTLRRLRGVFTSLAIQQFSFWHLMDFVGVLRLVMSLGGSG